MIGCESCCGVDVEDREARVRRRGLWWSLNPADHAHGGLFWMGEKYPWEIYHLSQLLQPGCTILDVGATTAIARSCSRPS